jgi:hypothetical protein
MINGGARFLSPMWGSLARDQMLHPSSFRAYDAMEGTAFEYQLVWWMRELQALPAGSLLYSFGNPLVASDDGWKPMPGTAMKKENGRLRLTGGSDVAVRSPPLYVSAEGQELRLEVSGTWPVHSAIRARLDFEGAKPQEHALAAVDGMARLSLSPPAGRPLTGVTLFWEGNKVGPVKGVTLDLVSVAVLP